VVSIPAQDQGLVGKKIEVRMQMEEEVHVEGSDGRMPCHAEIQFSSFWGKSAQLMKNCDGREREQEPRAASCRIGVTCLIALVQGSYYCWNGSRKSHGYVESADLAK
jgi:hypothetical protein